MAAVDPRDRPRLLVVDDEHHLAAAIRLNLELEGYIVDVATSAREAAARMVGPESYDAIVLDVMLPDSTGFEFCQRLREGAIFTPVLMLTALGRPKTASRGSRSEPTTTWSNPSRSTSCSPEYGLCCAAGLGKKRGDRLRRRACAWVTARSISRPAWSGATVSTSI